jgi:(1->4)-alpha-D-glucan 1-alpha-D-glucosylmutase
MPESSSLAVPLVATYRLQLTPDFGLRDAAALVPYLAGLGISHVYTSSYLQAAPGSTHGYDVVDPTAVNVELGGEDALTAFHEALREAGLGNVVDVVPNHMAVGGTENRLWWDVLRSGQQSPAARSFDIDWDPPEPKLRGKVLLPVLGATYAEELANGSITIARESCGPVVRYFDHRFPIDPDTIATDAAELDDGFADRDRLHQLLERQHYRLASWTVGRDELNYRRFFEVNTLAGVRVEDPSVFDATHQRTLEWVAEGRVQGLRIDHPDGLRDPGGYFARLRAAAPSAWIVVEKILEPGEALPDDWVVDGTTGYDAMQELTALFVEPASAAEMTDLYGRFTGGTEAYPDVLERCKRLAVQELLGTEVTRLTDVAARVCERSVVGRDTSRRTLRTAIEEILVSIPVYRTYVVDGRPSAADAEVIDETIRTARRRRPTIAPAVFDVLRSIWRGDIDDPEADELVARLQQLSGPAMAKGAEDTAFYRYHRLVALNEVGSDPDHFGSAPDFFHRAMADANATHPMSMLATSTHDTKRSEDVRVRIALLAEIPQRWADVVGRWRSANAPKWRTDTPDHNLEYLLYQTLVGAHPITRERLSEFATKAIREAKVHTSWLRPNDRYEAAVEAFIGALFDDPTFQAELAELVGTLVVPGRMAALAQALIKATGPGIPDFYQGSEWWTTSLVDPDNRTAVDYAARQAGVGAGAADALAADDVGTTKQRLIERALAVRRERPGSFVGVGATYRPIELTGERAGAAIAFGRGRDVVTVAVIRPVTIGANGWGDTAIDLPEGTWRNRLVDAGPALQGTVRLADLLAHDAVALLTQDGAA